MKIRFWSMATCDEYGATTTIHSSVVELITEYNNLRKEDGNYSFLKEIEESEMDTLIHSGRMEHCVGRYLNITVHEIEIDLAIKFSMISD